MKRNFSRDELISIRNSLVSLANNHDFGVFVDYLLDYCTMRVFMPGRVDTEEVMAYRALYNVTKAVLDDYRNHTGKKKK